MGTTARAKGVMPALLPSGTLPESGKAVETPRISGGTTVAVQAAELDPVSETDGVTALASSPIISVAGQIDVSRQLLDYSSPVMDRAIAADLGAALAEAVDAQILNGSGSSGQVTGLLNASGITTVTYTDGTPTQAEAWPKLMECHSTTSTAWGAPVDTVIAHPRRIDWFGNWQDTATGLVTPNYPGAVMQAAAMPTNLGAGTDEDAIIVLDSAEAATVYMSEVRFRAFPEVGSGTLTVRLRADAYLALVVRNPEAIGKVVGTGLVAPTFA